MEHLEQPNISWGVFHVSYFHHFPLEVLNYYGCQTSPGCNLLRYIAETNIEPTIFATKAAKGACVVSENRSLSDSAVDFTSITTMGAGAAVAIGIGYIVYKSLFRKQTRV